MFMSHMTKVQKIVLCAAVAMFLLPEILWNSVGNVMYDLVHPTDMTHPLRSNFLTHSDNVSLYPWVLLIQSVGLALACMTLLRYNLQNKKGVLLWLLVILLGLGAVVVFFILYFASHFTIDIL
jgi:hypothetical protein